jgi:two-component system cell cycle response regulator
VPARILVIEDNQTNLDLMVYLLRNYGYAPLIACNGEEGLEAARREIPDLIICDLQMPKLDGYEVARQIRLDPRLSKLPVVAVTAFTMRGDRDKVLAAGFDGYLGKPIVPEEFVSQVEAFLRPDRRSTVRPVASTADQTQPALTPYRSTLLVVDNSPVNLSLMRSILEPFGYKVLTVGTVKEALSLARENPPDLILSDLHMPDLDGYDFLKARMGDPDLRVVPLVLISSTVWRETDPRTALALGANKFMLRPIDPQELVSEIEACLQERREK